MRKNSNEEAGFTLIEVLLALAIGSLVISGFLSVFWAASNAYEKGVTASDIQYMARRGINDIEKDIKEAAGVAISNEGTELVLNKDTENEIIYRANNKNLYRVAKGTSVPIAENVRKIQFKEVDNGLVEVQLEVESRRQEYVLSTSVFPRTARP